MATIEDLLKAGKKLPHKEAEEHFSQAIEQAEEENDPSPALLAELYNRRGISRRMLGRFAESLNDYREAIICAGTGRDKDDCREQTSFALTNRADALRVGYQDFAKAHITLDEALTFTRYNSLMRAKAADQRGLLFRAEGQYVNALACYRNAEEISELLLRQEPENDEAKGEVKEEIESMLGHIHQHFGEAAFERYREIKNIPEKTGESTQMLKEAYQSQEKVLEIFSRLDSPNMRFNAYKMLGLIALEKNDLDSALKHQQEAYRLATEVTKYPRSVGITALYIAEVMLAQGDRANNARANNAEAAKYLEIFRQHVLDSSIPSHDYAIIKPAFRHTLDLSKEAGLEVEGVEELEKILG